MFNVKSTYHSTEYDGLWHCKQKDTSSDLKKYGYWSFFYSDLLLLLQIVVRCIPFALVIGLEFD